MKSLENIDFVFCFGNNNSFIPPLLDAILQELQTSEISLVCSKRLLGFTRDRKELNLFFIHSNHNIYMKPSKFLYGYIGILILSKLLFFLQSNSPILQFVIISMKQKIKISYLLLYMTKKVIHSVNY